ncbi:MAG TPA: hypothetical protein VN408_18545, partial [Actinoplanes sp.]|nr:hypothetical protein [Actinoplanes sp.]
MIIRSCFVAGFGVGLLSGFLSGFLSRFLAGFISGGSVAGLVALRWDRQAADREQDLARDAQGLSAGG